MLVTKIVSVCPPNYFQKDVPLEKKTTTSLRQITPHVHRHDAHNQT